MISGVIAEVAETVAVMYAGKIVEDGPVMEILSQRKSSLLLKALLLGSGIPGCGSSTNSARTPMV